MPSAVILGGGLGGMATADALAAAGCDDVTIIERGAELGGLAGTFHRDGNFYPLAYHHILHLDKTLLTYLDRLGALGDVKWRRIRMLFEENGRLLDLSRPVDFARFPMSFADKLRFVRLMLRAFFHSNWSDCCDESAADLIDRWGSPGVREAMFEPLTRIKFDLPCADVSAAWLGARLHHREGSAALGYIPGQNWTQVLCQRFTSRLDSAGVKLRLNTSVVALREREGRLAEIELDDGTTLGGDIVVNAMPTEIYRAMAPFDTTPEIAAVRYTAIVSAICATRQPIEPDFYWLNLVSLRHNAAGIFRLESLNPTIGAPGESCVNFMRHLPSCQHEFFHLDDDELLSRYFDDFRDIFGAPFEPLWTNITRVPMYSPVFVRGYRNPPLRSASCRNVYFAGNYRTYPSIASTGTALESGLSAAAAIAADTGLTIPPL